VKGRAAVRRPQPAGISHAIETSFFVPMRVDGDVKIWLSPLVQRRATPREPEGGRDSSPRNIREITMAEPFIGEIRVFGFNFAPRGWAKCNGQLLPISQNQALFSLLGTQDGGNGTSNFALPNLQGRAPVHSGTGSGGAPTVTHAPSRRT